MFCRNGQFFKFILPRIAEIIKPIYNFTRKGRKFIRREVQQQAFNKIKSRLVNLTVLHLLENKGRFHLYPDTSKFAAGSALYEIQNGKPKLIAYANK